MAQQPRWCVLACREWGISVLGLRRHGSTEKYPYASALRRRLTWTILPTDRWCRNWSSPWGAPMIKCHADTTPAGRGFRSGDARDYRFADAYRRVAQSRICTTVYSLAQRSQWGWARRLKTASAKRKTGEPNYPTF